MSETGVAQETLQNAVCRGSKGMSELEARQILGVTEKSSWKDIAQASTYNAENWAFNIYNAYKLGRDLLHPQNIYKQTSTKRCASGDYEEVRAHTFRVYTLALEKKLGSSRDHTSMNETLWSWMCESWPDEWVDRFAVIFAIDPPNIDNDRKHKDVWGNGRGRCCNFSVSNVWEDLRIRSQIVPWASLVWRRKLTWFVPFVLLIQYSQQLASTLSSHETCFTQAADSMFFMHEGLQQARARIYDVPSAIEILLTGTRVQSVATLGYRGYLTMWRILHLEVLVGEISGLVKLEETRHFVLGDDLERRMAASDTPFTTLYTILHEFFVPLIIDTVIRQIQALMVGRWKDAIRFELISDGYQDQGSSAGFVQMSQDGEADFVGLHTPGDKILYLLESEKNSRTSDAVSCPFIKIEPGSDLRIKYLSGQVFELAH
ncbi:mediator of RNA polymerase II transcription subunit 14 [Tanacetum coccineum]